MDFGGDLAILEPSIVYQIMSISRITGELRIVTVDNVASLYFKEGELLCATIGTRKKKLGTFLVEKEWITEEQLGAVLWEFESKGKRERIGNLLISHGYLGQRALTAAIQEQMKEVVYEVLSWKRGHFSFFHGVLPHDEDILLDVKLDHLILEGLKRLDEAQGSS